MGVLSIEDPLPIAAEVFDEYVFHWLGVLVARIGFTAALGLAEMDPSGGAGAAEARCFAESFELHEAEAAALVPVVRKAELETGQQVGG